MGIDKVSIMPVKDADIVVFDDDINIKMTILKGRVIYKSKIVK